MFTGTKASCEKSGTRLIRQPGSLVKLPAEFANDSLPPFAMPSLGYRMAGPEEKLNLAGAPATNPCIPWSMRIQVPEP